MTDKTSETSTDRKPADLRAAFRGAGVRPGQNDSRLLQELLDDLIRRDGRAATETNVFPPVIEILANKKLNGPQKLGRVKKLLTEARFPARARARSVFEAEIKQLKLHSKIAIEHEPNFEDNALEVSFKYSHPDELREIIRSLERLADRDPVNDALEATENFC